MIVEDEKIKLTREEYVQFRAGISGWEWHEYARLRPANVDLYKFMGASIVACIGRALIYVDEPDEIAQTVQYIKNVAGLK